MQTTNTWIYQANRFLQDQELNGLHEMLSNFIENWKAHGVKLNASFEIKHNLFVIIKVIEDQQNATGCSIDASVYALKDFQTQFEINFFNRQRVAYFVDNELKECSMAEFKNLAKEGLVSENTVVFDNTVTNVNEFESKWQTTAGNSWHKMLLQ